VFDEERMDCRWLEGLNERDRVSDGSSQKQSFRCAFFL
jgi:hypothetical protein